MQYTVFKPNKSNTGGRVQLKVAMTKNEKKDLWSKVLFAEFVPQKTWEESSQTGSFDYTKKRIISINTGEAGEILYSIQNNVPFQNYHKSGERSCWVKFLPFSRPRTVGKEGDKGYWSGQVNNFAFGYNEKGVGVNVPISSGEAQELKLLLESFIKESMALEAKEEERKFKARSKDSTKEVVSEDSETSEERESEDYDNQDIPF